MPFDEDTIHYNKAVAEGPVARLQERIDKGEVRLRYDSDSGYLLSILDELKISQILTDAGFLEDFLPRERISPHSRAILFRERMFTSDSFPGLRCSSLPLLIRNSAEESTLWRRLED